MYDIIIIGAGHAGVEAAYIASQFEKLKIGLITLPGVGIASAPCNPSIGGVGKGQVVREIDALGGLMGRLADLSGIQFRTLNESKGYAVQSTRIQIDKLKYSKNAESILSKIENIDIIREKVVGIDGSNNNFAVRTESSTWNSKKIIFTVGTFLNGKLHTGSSTRNGGRDGCESSGDLSSIIKKLKKVKNRFKTGTPARIDKKSVDYSLMEKQESDPDVYTFHSQHSVNARFLNQKSCYLTYTNSETLKIIRENKERSPMFNGQIVAVGARYCPSIEDKAYRYPDKDIHHVFVEPEGHDLDTLYPSGISTSLPQSVQKKMLQTIKGLEQSKILQYGYAVEYDVLDTTQLNKTLELKLFSGIYFAGQVNGTSGYEEAAGQGLIAGVNSALSLAGKEPLILSRNDSYIGVMIEDLVSNVRDEPYRLFTARSENRLFIREDNSVLRMVSYRKKLGLNGQHDDYINNFTNEYNLLYNLLNTTYMGVNDVFLQSHKIKVPRRTNIFEILARADVDPVKVLNKYIDSAGLVFDKRIIRTLAITAKYQGYISKTKEYSQKISKLDSKKIDWHKILRSENISFECKQRVKRIKPETFGQLKLIEGIRPATLAVVASNTY
ncbi:MAG: tRNA uridine-5-carboxymethylaminomethyl(34) synthesis enzyme MnmG [Bacteriovoracaceae bacterium]|jgi:tRNA uridine 5-carboxymethylaminomethyl modification enzyme|nr:tRNA uridine-5-carboxymethylaminomethyl(34) synthesis enzyme MnmG [Bacteriovoracaceae bacterium]